MQRALLMLAGVAALSSAPAAARERHLAPADEWQIIREEHSCIARRNFADPSGAPLRLDVEAFQPGRSYKFLMVGDALPLRDGLRRGVGFIRYRFKPDREWREAFAVTGYVAREDALSFVSDLSTEAEASRLAELAAKNQPLGRPLYQPDDARIAEVEQLALAYRSRDDTVLQLGPLREPLGKLQACAWELVSAWGYDPAALASQSSPPMLQNTERIGQELSSGMRAGSIGQNRPVHVRLDVDAAGKVTRCTIQSPRSDSPTENAICLLFAEDGLVAPARDAAGQPVAAPLFTRIVFGVWSTTGGIRLGRP
jgi:hypothetical protein